MAVVQKFHKNCQHLMAMWPYQQGIIQRTLIELVLVVLRFKFFQFKGFHENIRYHRGQREAHSNTVNLFIKNPIIDKIC